MSGKLPGSAASGPGGAGGKPEDASKSTFSVRSRQARALTGGSPSSSGSKKESDTRASSVP